MGLNFAAVWGVLLLALLGKTNSDNLRRATSSKTPHYDQIFANKPDYTANGFDFPVGKPNAKGYYNAQKFGKNTHLGDDWNGVKGGNSDLGDSVYTIANGYVTEATNLGGGWGNVIRIVHKTSGTKWHYVESLYAHCDKLNIKKGDWVKRGAQIGTIGNKG